MTSPILIGKEEDLKKSEAVLGNALGDMVHAPEIDGLSSTQKEYLLAMAQDDGPSSTGEIAKRLERNTGYANVYRTQLIKEDVIHSPAWGQVDFELPYMRDPIVTPHRR